MTDRLATPANHAALAALATKLAMRKPPAILSKVPKGEQSFPGVNGPGSGGIHVGSGYSPPAKKGNVHV